MRLLAFIVAILLLLLLALAPLIPLDSFRSQLSGTLSQRVNHTVMIGRLQARAFPPSLTLKDVSLMSPVGDDALLQAQEIVVKPDFGSLVQMKLAPRALHFHGWQVSVNRKQDGRWDWDEWITPTGRLGEQSGWPIQTVTFDRGEVHALDAYGPGPDDFVIQVLQGGWDRTKQYVSMDGVFASLTTPVSFQFQGSGSFLANPMWTAVVTLSDESRRWKLDCKSGSAGTEATGFSDQWRFDTAYGFLRYYSRLPLPPPVASPNSMLQDWKSQFDWKAGTLNFNQTAAVAGGRAEVTGKIQYQTVSTAHVDLALQGAKVQGIETALWGSAPLEGTASGTAKFDLTLSSQPWGSVVGQGALEFKDGKYFWPEASAKSLAKAKTVRYLSKKYPDFLQSGLTYSKASVHWQARRGLFTLDDAFFDLGDIQIALAGTYDAAHRGVDAYTRVQVHESSPDLLKELPPAYIDKSQGRVLPMHGRLQGTPNEWYLRAVSSYKVPPATQSKLSKAIRSK